MDWLCAQSPNDWTLQLGSFRTQEEVDEFIQRNQKIDNSNLRHARSADKSWYYLLYGLYPSREEAVRVRENLDARETWTSIRNIERLQSKRC